MNKKRIEEAIKILDELSNPIKESCPLGQALEAAIASLEFYRLCIEQFGVLEDDLK